MDRVAPIRFRRMALLSAWSFEMLLDCTSQVYSGILYSYEKFLVSRKCLRLGTNFKVLKHSKHFEAYKTSLIAVRLKLNENVEAYRKILLWHSHDMLSPFQGQSFTITDSTSTHCSYDWDQFRGEFWKSLLGRSNLSLCLRVQVWQVVSFIPIFSFPISYGSIFLDD